MTLFYITMNMQSRSGNPTHQIVASVQGVKDIEDFMVVLNSQDFMIVEEFYRKADGSGHYSVGEIILNTMHIGKVKVSS